MTIEPKYYQQKCLDVLRDYLRSARVHGAEKAFNLCKRPSGAYRSIPGWKESTQFPYVCIRVPTGGGKTFMAAKAVGLVAKEYLQTERHLVLWLAPSETIVSQTRKQLTDRGSAVHKALASAFGGQVAVLDVDEALYVTPATLAGACTVIVSTAQAWRVETKDGRRVYQPDNGNLMGHFEGLPASMLAGLDKGPSGRPVYSLANVLRLHRPIVIIDEGHRFRTRLTFETLKRFRPSAVVEFTATPYVEGKDRVPANVLVEATAAELKAAHMIKAPVILKGSRQWTDAVQLAIAKRKELQRLYEAEQKAGGKYVRPIVLFQAQPEYEDKKSITVDVLKKHLIESQGVPEAEIAVHTGEEKGLPADILEPTCRVNYVITVQALGEGWDCPFAYVLCTVAQLSANTAVEQILGRVLRMPYVSPKGNEALNQAYCFTSSGKFEEAAANLKEALVDAGFGKDEAEEMVKPAPSGAWEQDDAASLFRNREIPVYVDAPLDDNAKAKIQKAVPGEVRFEPAASGAGTTILYRGDALDEEAAAAIAVAINSDRDPVAAERFKRATWGEDASPAALGQTLDPPGLAVPDPHAEGGFTLFDSQHRETDWTLRDCDPRLEADDFDASPALVKTSIIDTEDDGGWTDRYRGEVRETVQWQDQTGPKTLEELSAWLDREVRDPRVTQSDKRAFIDRALVYLTGARGLGIETLAPVRWRLAEALSARIDAYRIRMERAEFQAFMENIVVVPADPGPDACFSFPRKIGVYPALRPYLGTKRFDKHFYATCGYMDGEEAVCAQYIDAHPNVRFWVRNLDRLDFSFWLPLVTGRFYPDFVARLHDGRYAAIEYKMAKMETDPLEQDKKRSGELWEARSAGRCVFVWVTAETMEVEIRRKLAARQS